MLTNQEYRLVLVICSLCAIVIQLYLTVTHYNCKFVTNYCVSNIILFSGIDIWKGNGSCEWQIRHIDVTANWSVGTCLVTLRN